MKNANMPAMPVAAWNRQMIGLTKREYFAGLIMQGLLAANQYALTESKYTAKDALEYADALLAELEKGDD